MQKYGIAKKNLTEAFWLFRNAAKVVLSKASFIWENHRYTLCHIQTGLDAWSYVWYCVSPKACDSHILYIPVQLMYLIGHE